MLRKKTEKWKQKERKKIEKQEKTRKIKKEGKERKLKMIDERMKNIIKTT